MCVCEDGLCETRLSGGYIDELMYVRGAQMIVAHHRHRVASRLLTWRLMFSWSGSSTCFPATMEVEAIFRPGDSSTQFAKAAASATSTVIFPARCWSSFSRTSVGNVYAVADALSSTRASFRTGGGTAPIQAPAHRKLIPSGSGSFRRSHPPPPRARAHATASVKPMSH